MRSRTTPLAKGNTETAFAKRRRRRERQAGGSGGHRGSAAMRVASHFVSDKRVSLRAPKREYQNKMLSRSLTRQKVLTYYGEGDSTLARFSKHNEQSQRSETETETESSRDQSDENLDNATLQKACDRKEDDHGDVIDGQKDEDEDELTPRMFWTQYRLFHPSSPRKIAWDMVTGVLILYSVIMVSYRIAFDNAAEGFADALDWLIDVIFVLDMCASFNTIYIDPEDQPITHRRTIAVQYLKSWFWIDFLSTIPIDRIVTWVLNKGAGVRSLKFFRVFRLVRLLKMMRLFKLAHVLGKAEGDGVDINPAIVNLVKLLVSMIFVAHILACVFFYIHWLKDPEYFERRQKGIEPEDGVEPPDTWFTQYSKECGADITDRTTQYVSSLYWTVATMTAVGYGDINATSDVERFFSILTQIVGAAVFGFVVGNISFVVESIDVQASHSKRKMQELRAYLIDRGLPKLLQTKIKAYYTYYLQRKSSCDEELLLSELSPGLRGQLMKETGSSEIEHFMLFRSADMGFVSAIFTKFKPLFHLPDDVISRQGTIGKEIYFLQYGKVEELFTTPVRGDRMEVTMAYHSDGSHFGEDCIFYQQPRQMSFRACVYSNLLVIQKEDFMEILNEWPDEEDAMHALTTLRAQLWMKVKLIVSERTATRRRTESTEQRMLRRQEEHRRALQAFDTVKFSDGEYLVNQGDKVDASSFILIIVEGVVKIQVDGKEVVRRGRGDCIGEGALLGTRRNASVIAVDNVVCAAIDAETFYISDEARHLINVGTMQKDASHRTDSEGLIKTWNTAVLSAAFIRFFRKFASGEVLECFLHAFFAMRTCTSPEIVALLVQHPAVQKAYAEYVREAGLPYEDVVRNVYDRLLPEVVQMQHVLSMLPDGLANDGLPRVDMQLCSEHAHAAEQEQELRSAQEGKGPPWQRSHFMRSINEKQKTHKAVEHQRRKSLIVMQQNVKKFRRASVLSMPPSKRGMQTNIVKKGDSKYIVNPKSDFKYKWDVLIGMFIVYSVLIVPYRIGFQREAALGEFIFDCLIDALFLADMVINFRTGYEDDHGRLVTDTTTIARRYLRGWFAVDLMSTVPFDLIVKLIVTGDWKGGDGSLRSLKLIRVLRLIRLLKLVRMAKLVMLINVLEEEYAMSPTVMRLFKLAFQMSLFAHIISCGWFFVCSHGRALDEGPSWLAAAGLEGAPAFSLYLASVYWAFTTVSTTGYGDLVPQNDLERLYVVFCMLVGALLFGYVVGSMASLVGKLDIGAARRRERIIEIKQYLKDKKVSRAVRNKVLRYQHRLLDRVSVFNEESILSELSDSLRQEVLLFLNADIIDKIPLFDNQDEGFVVCVMSLLRPEYAVADDFVFREGDLGKTMYFLVTGQVEILSMSASPKPVRFAVIKEGDFFGEIAVLMPVRRTASVRALSACSFFVLTKSAFESIRIYYPSVAFSIMKMINSTIQGMEHRNSIHRTSGLAFSPSYRAGNIDRQKQKTLKNYNQSHRLRSNRVAPIDVPAPDSNIDEPTSPIETIAADISNDSTPAPEETTASERYRGPQFDV